MKYNIKELFGVGTALVLLSIGGSITSTKIREGLLPYWSQLFFTFGMACVWMYQVKFSKASLLFNSAYYDIVACTTWLGMLAYMGDPLSLKQKFGLLFALVGIIMMA